MVAAWGGYVFIINIIPIYVVVMVIAGRYSSRLYIAYSTFYALGSIMAMQVECRAMKIKISCHPDTGRASAAPVPLWGGWSTLQRPSSFRLYTPIFDLI